MAIGERIRFIRNLRGMTQKYLGTLVGFSEKTADIRMAQYEAGTRTPKEDRDGEVILRFDSKKGRDAANISKRLKDWAPIAEKYRAGEISKDEYDKWRYHYPKYDTAQIWGKVPSQELSDAIVKDRKAKKKL